MIHADCSEVVACRTWPEVVDEEGEVACLGKPEIAGRVDARCGEFGVLITELVSVVTEMCCWSISRSSFATGGSDDFPFMCNWTISVKAAATKAAIGTRTSTLTTTTSHSG